MPKKVTFDVTANTKGAAKELGILGQASQKLHGIFAKLGPVGDVLSGVFDKLQGGSLSMAGAVGIGTAALGAAVAVAEKAIDQYVQLGTKIRAYARITGESAEQASRQVAAFEELGVSSDVAAAGMFKLAKAIANTPEKLAALGIQIVKNAEGNVDLNATLLNVMNAYQLTGDAAKRAAIIFAAFGKAGAAMAPILETNAAQLKFLQEQVASVYTQHDLDQIRKYGIAQKELKEQTDELGVSLGRLLLPAQLGFIESMNESIYVSKKFAEATEGGSQSLGTASHASGKLSNALHEQYRKAQEAIQATDALAASALAAADAAKREAEAEDALYNALHKSQDANFAYRQSLLDLKKAQKDATDAKGLDAEANLRLEEAYFKVSEAAVEMALQQAEVAGKTLTAAEKADIQIDSLKRLEKHIRKGSPTYNAIEAYIAELRKIPADVYTATHILGSTTHPGGGGVQEFAEGGVVGGPTGSAQLAIVHGGEEVIPAGGNGAGGGGLTLIIQGGIFMDHGPTLDALSNALLRHARFRPGR